MRTQLFAMNFPATAGREEEREHNPSFSLSSSALPLLCQATRQFLTLPPSPFPLPCPSKPSPFPEPKTGQEGLQSGVGSSTKCSGVAGPRI